MKKINFRSDAANEDVDSIVINSSFSLITLSLASRFLDSFSINTKISLYLLSRAAQLGYNSSASLKKDNKNAAFNLLQLTLFYSSLIFVDYFSNFRMIDLEWSKLGLAIGADWISLSVIPTLSEFIKSYPKNCSEDIKQILSQNLALSWKESKTDSLVFKLNEANSLQKVIGDFLQEDIKKIFRSTYFNQQQDLIEIKARSYDISLNYQQKIQKLTALLNADISKIKICYQLTYARLAQLEKITQAPWKLKIIYSHKNGTIMAYFFNDNLKTIVNLEKLPFIYFSAQINNINILYPTTTDEAPAIPIDILYLHRHPYRDILVTIICKVINLLTSLLFLYSTDSQAYLIISAIIPLLSLMGIYLIDYRLSYSLKKQKFNSKKISQYLFTELLFMGGLLLSLGLFGKWNPITLSLSGIYSSICGLFCLIYPIEHKKMWEAHFRIEKIIKVLDLFYYFFPDHSKDIQIRHHAYFSDLEFIADEWIKSSEENKLLLKVINNLLPLFIPGTKTIIFNDNKLVLQFNQEISSICKKSEFLPMLIRKTQDAYSLAFKLMKLNIKIENIVWGFSLRSIVQPAFDYEIRIQLERSSIRSKALKLLQKNFNVLINNNKIYLSLLSEIIPQVLDSYNPPDNSSINSDKDAKTEVKDLNNLDNKPFYDEKIWHQHQYSKTCNLNENFSIYENDRNKRLDFIINFIQQQRIEEKAPHRMLTTECKNSNTVIYYEPIEKIYRYLLPLMKKQSVDQPKIIKIIQKSGKNKSLKIIFDDLLQITVVCHLKSLDPALKVAPINFMKIPSEADPELNLILSKPSITHAEEEKLSSVSKESELGSYRNIFSSSMGEVIRLTHNCFINQLNFTSDFSNPYSREFKFLSILAKISYAAHLFDSSLVIHAVGGFIRSILMRSSIHDLDLRTFFIKVPYSPQDLLNYLIKNNIIQSFLRCNIESECIYTISVENTIVSLRFAFSENYKADATANALSLAIGWRDSVPYKVSLNIPKISNRFINAIQKGIVPEYELYPDFGCIQYLETFSVKIQIEQLVCSISHNSKLNVNQAIIKLLSFSSTDDIDKLMDDNLTKIIISILVLISDVKIIFKSLLRYDQAQFYFPEWMHRLFTAQVVNLLKLAALVYSGNNNFKNLVLLCFHNYLLRNTEGNNYLKLSQFLFLTKQVIQGTAAVAFPIKPNLNMLISKSQTRTDLAELYKKLIKGLTKKHAHSTAIDILLLLTTLTQVNNLFNHIYMPAHPDNQTQLFLIKQKLLSLFKTQLQQFSEIFQHDINIEKIFGPQDSKCFDYRPRDLEQIIYQNWCNYQQKLQSPYSFRFLSNTRSTLTCVQQAGSCIIS